MLARSLVLSFGLAIAPVAFAQGGAKVPPAADVKAAATATDAKKADAKADKAPAAATASKTASGPVVELKTSLGSIKIELDEKAAPITTKNFLAYVGDKFYDGTVFHRVINGFMVQGGGYTMASGKLSEKKTNPSIKNEGQNGLKNDRGTIAMARTPDPDSASSQFFINHANNDMLNFPKPDGHGYAVFGKVTEGLDIVDKIAGVKTGVTDGMQDVPTEEVKIISATVVKPNS